MIKKIKAKIKLMVYKKALWGAIYEMFPYLDEYVSMFTKLAISCKTLEPDEVQKLIISTVADRVRSENKKANK